MFSCHRQVTYRMIACQGGGACMKRLLKALMRSYKEKTLYLVC